MPFVAMHCLVPGAIECSVKAVFFAPKQFLKIFQWFYNASQELLAEATNFGILSGPCCRRHKLGLLAWLTGDRHSISTTSGQGKFVVFTKILSLSNTISKIPNTISQIPHTIYKMPNATSQKSVQRAARGKFVV